MNYEIKLPTTPGQTEVLIYFEQHSNEWLTSRQIAKALNVSNKNKISHFLKMLYEYEFLLRQKKEGSITLEYKYNESRKNI